MGYYIETPESAHKEIQLSELYGAIIQDSCPQWESLDHTKQALVCVVKNRFFDAAAFVYDKSEYDAFQPTSEDNRPRTWLLMDYEIAAKVSGFRS